MATKVIILGEQSEQKQELKKIEFVKVLISGGFVKAEGTARRFESIELICRNYGGEGSYDIMFAYDGNRSNGLLYLGHFNDGVV